jgi:hypothetical protein
MQSAVVAMKLFAIVTWLMQSKQRLFALPVSLFFAAVRLATRRAQAIPPGLAKPARRIAG